MTRPFAGGPSALTHLLVVENVGRARDFWVDVVGATLYREYGGTSCVLRLLDTWMLLVTGGGPTKDKPDTRMTPPADTNTVDHAVTIRVEDCQAAYEDLASRGASFLTPPVDHGSEVRAFFRDPDGHLVEISQATP
jgi:catechol 2,3-dioxygenase-like lactoylglutathione lyase family enzyme